MAYPEIFMSLIIIKYKMLMQPSFQKENLILAVNE